MLLLEMTLYQLDRSTTNAFGPERQVRSNRIQVNQIQFTPVQAAGNTQLNVVAKIRGTTGNPYESTIVFKRVKLEDQDLPTNITVKSTGGQDLHINAASLNSTDVQVRCTCLDFYYRFALWNHRKKSLYGDPPDPYVKTTNRPPVNPTQKPGVCKHIYKLMLRLKSQGVMKDIDHSSEKDREVWGDRADRAKEVADQERQAQQQPQQGDDQAPTPNTGTPPRP